jgi:hypothetical protein
VAGLCVFGVSQAISPVRGHRPLGTLPEDFRAEGGTVPKTTTYRELARRSADGMRVTLLWSRADDRLAVEVSDAKSGRHFELDAPRERALDVFYHPYAYATAAGGC